MNQTRDRCARPRQRRKEGKEPKVFDVFFLYSKRGETLSECAAASGRDDLDRWPVIERVINAVAGERETPFFLLSPPFNVLLIYSLRLSFRHHGPALW